MRRRSVDQSRASRRRGTASKQRRLWKPTFGQYERSTGHRDRLRNAGLSAGQPIEQRQSHHGLRRWIQHRLIRHCQNIFCYRHLLPPATARATLGSLSGKCKTSWDGKALRSPGLVRSQVQASIKSCAGSAPDVVSAASRYCCAASRTGSRSGGSEDLEGGASSEPRSRSVRSA